MEEMLNDNSEEQVVVNNVAEMPAEKQDKKKEMTRKTYNILNVIPAIVFFVGGVLSLLFMLFLPVAKITVFGLNEEFGTLISGDRFSELHGVGIIAIIMMVVTYITFIIGIIDVGFWIGPGKYTAIFGKRAIRVLEFISAVLFFLLFVLSIVMMGLIASVDDGVGIIRCWYPVWEFIVCTVVLVAAIILLIFCIKYEIHHCEVKEEWKVKNREAVEKGKTKKKGIITSVSGPIGSKIISLVMFFVFFGGAFYYSATSLLEKYDLINFDSISDTYNLFDKLGTTTVGESAFKKATGSEFGEDGTVTIYTHNYGRLAKKAEDNQKYLLLAIQYGDKSRVSKLLKQEKRIEEEAELLVYGKVEASYTDRDGITRFVGDSIIADAVGSVDKLLKKVEIVKTSVKANEDGTNTLENIVYKAWYKDGSIIYDKVPASVKVSEDSYSSIFTGSLVGKTITWTDQFGEYITTVTE